MTMVVEAVLAIDDKSGSSLNAIRKYILQNYDVKQQQTASFNSLTLKAVNKAVATGELEKSKHSFKISQAEKLRRKEKVKRAYKLAKEAARGDLGGGSDKNHKGGKVVNE